LTPGETNSAILKVSNLEVNYGAIVAIQNVSLVVHRSSITFVVGPNGAGKSTLLLAIAGVLTPRAGSIEIDGACVSGIAPEEVARIGCSLVPEGRQIFSTLSVVENLKLGEMVGNRRSGSTDLDRVLSYFPKLRERYRQAAGSLSGGEQQQLSIARALLTKPKLLMIDEPSLGLAPLVIDGVYDVLNRLREDGLTMLIVEQRTARVTEAGDHVFVLRHGHVVFSEKCADLSDHEELEVAYFGYDAH
jgi:branched-chain amino acid transport system ATP-binding protein